MLREIWAGSPSQGKPSVFKKGQPGPQGASTMGPTQVLQPVSGVWFPSSAAFLGFTFLIPQWPDKPLPHRTPTTN